MLVIEERAVDRPDLEGAYLDGSLELLRELEVTGDVERAAAALRALPLARADRGARHRSLVRVAIPARDRLVAVAFWSKQANAYDSGHLPLARRIVEHLAVGVCHKRLANTVSTTVDERSRKEPTDSHTRIPSVGSGFRTNDKHLVGESAEWLQVLNQAVHVAKTDTTVLVTGESGNGEGRGREVHPSRAAFVFPYQAVSSSNRAAPRPCLGCRTWSGDARWMAR